MGARGRHAEPHDPEFDYHSPVAGLNREQYNFLLGKFRWTAPESPWKHERGTREAWKRFRDELLEECPPGIRPLAFWRFDKKLPAGEAPWLYQVEENYRLVLKHRCYRDEAEKEFCRNELAGYLERERIARRNEEARIAAGAGFITKPQA